MSDTSSSDYANLIANKSERLVTAMYLVTDLLHDDEPIKRSLRKNGVTLLSSMNALAQIEVKDRLTEYKLSLKATTEVISLLHVATSTGIVSQMNGEILMRGFRTLETMLHKKQFAISADMLMAPHEEAPENLMAQTVESFSSSYDVITAHKTSYEEKKTRDQREVVIKDKNTETSKSVSYEPVQGKTLKIATAFSPQPKPQLSSSFQMRKQSRKDQILSLFVPGVDVSIKDISARIKGCSEKTIQRELNALLYSNKIERIGEKRWSRYVLK